MTDFLFSRDGILVNDQKLSRYRIVVFLARLYEQFPPPKSFSLGEIKSDYSEKTKRAMISIFEQLQFLKVAILSKDKRMKVYTFQTDADFVKMVLNFAEIGREFVLK